MDRFIDGGQSRMLWEKSVAVSVQFWADSLRHCRWQWSARNFLLPERRIRIWESIMAIWQLLIRSPVHSKLVHTGLALHQFLPWRRSTIPFQEKHMCSRRMWHLHSGRAERILCKESAIRSEWTSMKQIFGWWRSTLLVRDKNIHSLRMRKHESECAVSILFVEDPDHNIHPIKRPAILSMKGFLNKAAACSRPPSERWRQSPDWWQPNVTQGKLSQTAFCWNRGKMRKKCKREPRLGSCLDEKTQHQNTHQRKYP